MNFKLTGQADEGLLDGRVEFDQSFHGWMWGDNEISLSLAGPRQNGCYVNDDAESAEEVDTGPMAWLNSANVRIDPEQNRAVVGISLNDPRGALCMTVWKTEDRTLLTIPHPSDGFRHVELREVSPGTYEVCYSDGTPWGGTDEILQDWKDEHDV